MPALILLSSACSNRHQITIDPLVPVHPSETGAGKPVTLKVIDARPSNIIAKWRGGLRFRKFTISPDSDIAETLEKKISEGLTTIGFQHKRHAKTVSRLLKVEILQVKSIYIEKIPRLDVKIRTSLRATCSNKNLSYKKIYSDRQERKNLAPGNLTVEKLVNASLSNTLRKLFADSDLIDCLAR